MNRNTKMVLGTVVLLAALVALVVLGGQKHLSVVRAQNATGAPIHGYVAAVLTPELQIGATANQSPIFNVPDINVVARNVKTRVTSAAVKTNPEGYFRTDSLPPGEYQLCVDGPGYATSCDPKAVSVVNSIVVLDHIVEIRPTSGFVAGTVRLADQVTNCFWFRPAFDTNAVITAKVSLLDGAGTVVAGPVSGQKGGQNMLPASPGHAGFYNLATCGSAAHGASGEFLRGGPVPKQGNCD